MILTEAIKYIKELEDEVDKQKQYKTRYKAKLTDPFDSQPITSEEVVSGFNTIFITESKRVLSSEIKYITVIVSYIYIQGVYCA
jgi:fumarate hydratase class II